MSELIDPDGTGDRLSLTAWEAAAADADAICTSSSGSADTADFTLNAFSGAATITAQAGDEAVKTSWDASRYRLDTDQISMNVQVGVVITGLQMRCTTSNGSDRVISSSSTATRTLLKCRIHHDDTADQPGSSAVVCSNTGNFNVINCIIAQESANGERGTHAESGAVPLYVYSSVVMGFAATGIETDGTGTERIKNCAVFDNDISDFAGTFTEILSCASDDGDGTDPVAPASSDWDNEFADPSTFDFTLLTGGNLESAGLDLSADGDYSFNDDIDGDTRSDWDIGADEIAGAAATSFPPVVPRFITSPHLRM